MEVKRFLRDLAKHVAPFAEDDSARPSREELARLPRHMRPQGLARRRTGTRQDTALMVTLDGRRLLEQTYRW